MSPIARELRTAGDSCGNVEMFTETNIERTGAAAGRSPESCPTPTEKEGDIKAGCRPERPAR